MTYEASRHYREERTRRNLTIEEIGEGKVIYDTVRYDSKRKRTFLYEITDNAILIVKSTDSNTIITKMIARPSRIKQYWEDAPEEVMRKAIAHAKAKMFY